MIIGDKNMVRALENIPELSDDDVAVVFIEMLDDRTYARTALRGLDYVLDLAARGIPIIALGWMTPTMGTYADEPRWHAAMSYPNVVFVRLPANQDQILTGLAEAKQRKRPEDPLARKLLTAVQFRDVTKILDHDLGNSQRSGEEAMKRWEAKASAHFGTMSRGELIEKVRQQVSSDIPTAQFEGQEFPDVCVDVEDTLLDNAGNLRQDVADLVKKYATTHPITLWTGGNLDELSKKIRRHGLPYKLISKYTMRGAQVAVVIDDLPEPEFIEKYGIHCGEYQQV